MSFSEEQVGRVWGNDMLGFSLGAVVAALSVARVNRRRLVMGGIVFSMGANALCMFIVDYESMMWLRFAAVVGLLLAALYDPVWTSAILSPADFGLALAAFTLLVFWKTPAWLVVILTALSGWALHAGLMS